MSVRRSAVTKTLSPSSGCDDLVVRLPIFILGIERYAVNPYKMSWDRIRVSDK